MHINDSNSFNAETVKRFETEYLNLAKEFDKDDDLSYICNIMNSLEEKQKVESKTETTKSHTTVLPLSRIENKLALKSLYFRKEVCDELGVGIEKIPFFGEFITVNSSEWETACENIMRGFALTMIVPWEYSDVFLALVAENSTDIELRTGWYVASFFDEQQELKKSPGNLLCDKISVDLNTKYHNMIKNQLLRKFDFECCEAVENLLFKEKGVLKNGIVRKNQSFDFDGRVFQFFNVKGNNILGRGRNFGFNDI